MKPTKKQILKAFDEIIEKYDNPVNSMEWVSVLLNPRKCLFCKIFEASIPSYGAVKCHGNCPLFPCRQNPHYLAIRKYYKQYLYNYDGWGESKKQHEVFKKLKKSLSEAANYLVSLKKKYE